MDGTNDPAQEIWTATLDKRYLCRVMRLTARAGILSVYDQDAKRTLLEKTVGLSYGAQYGPDVADVADWQRMIETAIDNPPPKEPSYLVPPKHWSRQQRAFSLAARHYERIMEAEYGGLDIEVASLIDLTYEMGMISAALDEDGDSPEVSDWIDWTTKRWIQHKAKDAGIATVPCRACGRITHASKEALCPPCARKPPEALST